jgi:uncharacterized protein YcgI (DUF1989 family)
MDYYARRLLSRISPKQNSNSKLERRKMNLSNRIVVPAAEAVAVSLRSGQALRVVNVHGTQVVDTWAFAQPDLGECLSMEHTRTSLKSLRIRPGDSLYSNRRRPLLTMTADTSPGDHDTLIAACDPQRYIDLGYTGHHANCAENLRTALSAIGHRRESVPAPLNLFMNITWNVHGDLTWLAPSSRAKDYVELRAEQDVVIVCSACPMDLLPINGEGLIPHEVAIEMLGAL